MRTAPVMSMDATYSNPQELRGRGHFRASDSPQVRIREADPCAITFLVWPQISARPDKSCTAPKCA